MSELPPDTPERGIEFRYIRSNEFRTYHTDGVMGHWTPRGKLYLEGFTERAALPDAILHRVDEEGRPGDVLQAQGFRGYVRERTFGLVLDPETALILRDWLSGQIDLAIAQGRLEISQEGMGEDDP